MSFGQTFSKTITINATPEAVWAALTDPSLMRRWMSETPIEVVTEWKVGEPIVVRGDWYKTGFTNKGIVERFEPGRLLRYTHLSSLSRLTDDAENYTVFEFRLAPEDARTILTVTVSNFPTEAIYRHMVFYWNVAVELLRRFVEARQS